VPPATIAAATSAGPYPDRMDQEPGLTREPLPVRPRTRSTWWRVSRPLATAGRVLFYLVMGVLILIGGVLGVGGILSAGEPVIWGTFTEERCEPARYVCRSIGTWVSDDGTIQKHGIALDGRPGPDGTVRASYRPTGFNDDDSNNIVHVEAWTLAFVWFPWAFVAILVGVVMIQTWEWRRLA
jgi:hypothetical protein